MYEIFADLHIHIGRSENGKPIKITGARSLNFANIAKECCERKGIQVAGIIDCASPYVIEDIENFLKTGDAYELQDGGIIYKDKVCILLGSECASEFVKNVLFSSSDISSAKKVSELKPNSTANILSYFSLNISFSLSVQFP